MPRRSSAGVRNLLLGLGGVLVMLVAWELAAATGFVSETRISRPAAVLNAIPGLLASSEFRSHLAGTMVAWAIAMALMIVVAVPAGLAIGSARSLSEPTNGLVHVMRSIPATALIPFAILYFGLGLKMKVALASYAIGWPILLSAIYGAQSVDPEMRTVARALRLRPWRVFFSLTLPSAARYIGTGVRVAGGIGFVVILGAELLGASSGLGTLIVRFQRNEVPASAFGGILIVGTIGVLMYQLLSAVEKKLSPWSPEHRHS